MLELARQRADGVINRSKTRDTPCFPLAAKGRLGVWNSHRGNHLGQRSCASAKTGRTYGRKRSDQSTAQITLRGGGRPHMESRRAGSVRLPEVTSPPTWQPPVRPPTIDHRGDPSRVSHLEVIEERRGGRRRGLVPILNEICHFQDRGIISLKVELQ
jgi:hypothetical protein